LEFGKAEVETEKLDSSSSNKSKGFEPPDPFAR